MCTQYKGFMKFELSSKFKDNSRTIQGQFKDNSRTIQGQFKLSLCIIKRYVTQ